MVRSAWLLSTGFAAVLASSGAGAALLAENSDFGSGTITHDSATGQRWLDLTESADYSHAQILDAIGPGGTFDGYRLASDEEIAQLLLDADIDLDLGSNFVPQNYAAIVALAALIGVSGDHGNCGSSCTFFYTHGWTDEGPGSSPNTFRSTGIAWFDNSGGQAPSFPMAPIGRVSFGGSRSDDASPDHGAWLVQVPEPGVAALASAAGGALFALRVRRAARIGDARRTG